LFLIKIQPPSNVRKVTASECIEKNVFVDGGDELNPRIVLPQLALRKEVLVLSVLLGDIFVPNEHLCDPDKGLILDPPSGVDVPIPIMLIPRKDALMSTGLLRHG